MGTKRKQCKYSRKKSRKNVENMWFLSCLNKSSNTQYALTCKAVASIYYPGKKWVHLNLVRWRHHSQDPPSGVFHSGWNSRGDRWDVLWLPPEWCCHKLVKINICSWFRPWISILSEFSAVFLQLDSSLETSANSAPVPSYNATGIEFVGCRNSSCQLI